MRSFIAHWQIWRPGSDGKGFEAFEMSRFYGSIVAIAAIVWAGGGMAGAEQFKIATARPDRMTEGTTAFIDQLGRDRIVEIDAAGKVVWQCSLKSISRSENLRGGADLEWIAVDDAFLVVVPFTGIFRLNRKCAVTWRYRTAKVSHDADLLPNGNILYTFGWDGKPDAQAVEIDPAGKVVWRWQAAGKLDPSERRVEGPAERERRPSFTHANAVVRLENGDTLVSLRNFHRVVQVAPDGSIRRTFGPIRFVHEPNLLADGTLIAAARSPMTVIALRDGARRVVFSNEIGIRPIRTVQPLARGNFLLSGGADLVEIDSGGEVVWHAKIYGKLRRPTQGIYKAVRILK
jgi:hypothetical protein